MGSNPQSRDTLNKAVLFNCIECGGPFSLTWTCRDKAHERGVVVENGKACPRCSRRRRGPRQMYCSSLCIQRAYDRRHAFNRAKREHFKSRRRVLKKHGLTFEDFEEMKEFASGRCEACFCLSSGELNIDHDHKTKMVRGLLCRRCNLALGLLKDRLCRIEGLIGYLKDVKNKKTSAFRCSGPQPPR